MTRGVEVDVSRHAIREGPPPNDRINAHVFTSFRLRSNGGVMTCFILFDHTATVSQEVSMRTPFQNAT